MNASFQTGAKSKSQLQDLFARPLEPWLGSAGVSGCGRVAFDVLDPSTARPIARVSGASIEDAGRALDIASDAFTDWSSSAPATRSALLRRIAALLRERKEAFATLITLEMGKILTNSLREVDLAIEYVDWFAEEAQRIDGSCGLSPDGAVTMLTVKKPVGVVLLVTPWNFPLVTIVRKLGPAIAAGCAAILKPSEETPLTALAFAELVTEAGAPDGLFCVLPTIEPAPLISRLMADRRMRKISFTGSLDVGRLIQQQAAANMMRSSMELGGNAPFIVFEDADMSLAVQDAVAAKLSATGQVCTAPNRFLVHRSRYKTFSDGLADIFSIKRVGPGLDSGSEVGPLVSERARQRISDMIDDATRRGGALLAGGSAPAGDGFFLNPTVIGDAPQESVLWRNEIFGPVAQIAAFDNEDEAIRLSNQSDAGLSSYVYTSDVERVFRLGHRLRVGMLGVNRVGIVNAKAPFGGVGLAGLGREGGADGVEDYLDTTYVGVNRPGR